MRLLCVFELFMANVTNPPAILIADGQPEILAALASFAEGEGCRVQVAASARELLQAVESVRFDAALVDIDMARSADPSGMTSLSRLRALDPDLPIVVTTAHGSIELGLETVRDGARDFLQKPWDPSRLKMTLRTQVEFGRTLRELRRLKEENQALRASLDRRA
jgi:DNA-binding NtrC family response regulator